MRNGQNKRMRGRNRNHKGHSGGGGSGGGGGGGGHHHNPLTRVYESNGPEVKIRGNAHHIAEKYLQLARDAHSAGDPVTAENFFQHAEHYFRLIATAQEQFRQQNPYYQAPPAPGQGAADEVFDGDEEDGSQPTQIPGNFGQSSAPQPNFNPQSPPQPNYSGGQPNYNNNNQQPNYQPREQQAQPYGGQQSNYQPRPPQQSYNNNQPQSQPQYQQPQAEQSDGERLPSFITGAQPPQQPAAPAQNGDDNSNGERYPRHRRRRHRSSGPRPEMASGAPQDLGGDASEPGNS